MAQSSSPFLRLPRELRDKIYRSILIQDAAIAIKPVCPDLRHMDGKSKLGVTAYTSCDYRESHYLQWNKHIARIVDVDILRVNNQIHREAQQIFLEENTFHFPGMHPETRILRENAMKTVTSITASFVRQPRSASHYHTPGLEDLSRFVAFLKSRPPLKRLQLTLHEKPWDVATFKDLFSDVKVRAQVSIDLRDLEVWSDDPRERGTFLIAPDELTDEDREFRVLAKEMESTMLVSESATPTPFSATTETFPFLKLPRELRDKVYRSLLVQDAILHASCPDCKGRIHSEGRSCDSYNSSPTKNPDLKVPDLDILRANRQIYFEAREIFCTDNVFHFEKSRMDTMKYAGGIKTSIISLSLRVLARLTADSVWDVTLPEFITFLELRPPLRTLQLTFIGPDWDQEVYTRLRKIKVKKQASINVHMPACGKYGYTITEADNAFVAFTKDLEKSMLIPSTLDHFPTTTPRSSFLDLPRELRDKIYCSILLHDAPIRASCPDCGHSPDMIFNKQCCEFYKSRPDLRPPTKIPDLDILRVNSQIHDEALEILHKTNILRYEPEREKAMEQATMIKAHFHSGNRGPRGLADLSRFMKSFESHTMLKKLYLGFEGSFWDQTHLKELFTPTDRPGMKVQEYVSMYVILIVMEPFQWPTRIPLSDFNEKERAFHTFVKSLEGKMLASSPPDITKTPDSPFLRLPIELRNKIYHSILIHDKALRASCPDCKHILHTEYGSCSSAAQKFEDIRPPLKITDLDILRTNKQINTESTAIFLEENTFEYEKSRRENAVTHVSGFRFEVYNYPSAERIYTFINDVASRPPLKKLHLVFYGPGWDLDIYRAMCDRVKYQVIVDVEIQGWDSRDGSYPLPLKEWTQMDKDFVVAAKKLEKNNLAISAR